MSAASNATTALPGQDTLLACWRALATLSPGARVTRAGNTEIARFPAWSPLNNAILIEAGDDLEADAATASAQLAAVYGRAGIDTWALWIPSRATDFRASDRVSPIAGLQRDTTTVVMQKSLSRSDHVSEGVVPTSIASVARVGVEPMTASDLDPPDDVRDLTGWALVHDGVVVASAWTFLHERDCGIFGVETLVEWRRRGFASALMQHMLAEARRRGAETASLQSTSMGVPLYQSLRFEAVGRYEEWVPAGSAARPPEVNSRDSQTRSRNAMPSITIGSG